MKRVVVSLIAAFLCGGTGWSAAAQDWTTVKTPSPGPTQSIGFYSAGCLQGAKALPLDGPGYEAIRISRNRYWGQPVTLRFIETLSEKIHAKGQAPLYIGDVGQPRGGPSPIGHASHQNGLDADIWYEREPGPRRPPAERENPRLRSLVIGDRTLDNSVFNAQHATLIRTTAEMPNLDRMFVNRWIKARLCQTTTGDRLWLHKVVPWYGHDDHFHVRLYCPPGNPQCQPQADYPHDDGCGAALDWWLKQPPTIFPSDEVMAKRYKPPRLPDACQAVLHAP